MLSDRAASYVSSIDGLRAVAVLTVMAYHLNRTFLPGGFVGVDVFFVISGFVVTLSIYKLEFTNIAKLFCYFYARRLTRIAPALIVMLSLISLATVSFIPNAWLSDANRRTALYAYFGISNILLANQEEDYFGPRADFNPFVHTWSLGVEEQFYVIFPMLLMPLTVLNLKRGPLITLIIIVFLSVCSFAACVAFTPSYPVSTFFHISTRFWELGVGVGLALSNASWHRYM